MLRVDNTRDDVTEVTIVRNMRRLEDHLVQLHKSVVLN
jgi:hypothetical protein